MPDMGRILLLLLQLTGKTGFYIPACQQSHTVCSKRNPMNINIMGVFTPPVKPVSIYSSVSNRAPGAGADSTARPCPSTLSACVGHGLPTHCSLGVRQLNFLWKLQCSDPVSQQESTLLCVNSCISTVFRMIKNIFFFY
jgi:hypothetical protein